MKKFDQFTEHYCIPLGLFVLNCSIIHFLFLLPAAGAQAGSYRLAVGAACVALIITIAGKIRWGILLVSLLYTVLLLYAIFAVNAASY